MPIVSIISNSAFSVVNFRSTLIKDIIENGCSVYVLAPDFTETFRSKLKKLGAEPVTIKMARTGMSPVKDVVSVVDMVAKLRRLKPDITFSYGIKPVVYGLIASKIAGVPKRFAMVAGLGSLYSVRSSEENLKSRGLRSLADFLYRISLPFAQNIFFQNPDDISLFSDNGIINEGQAVLLNGSGVDTDLYRSETVQKDPITFTLVSRLILEKGIHEFVESARHLKQKYSEKDIRFILLGEPDLNPNSISEDKLNRWVEEGLVEWPGHVDNVKYWLEKTSVFVLPTYYREGTPKSILEAMSMGRPVITTDMPGCREAVTDRENGFLIAPKDTEALIASMEQFIQSPDIINSMGAKSRAIAERKYDVGLVNAKMLDVMGIM